MFERLVFLLLMYLSPLLAVTFYWRARRTMAAGATGVVDADVSVFTLPDALRLMVEGRAALVRPVIFAAGFCGVLVACATSVPAFGGFLLGSGVAVFTAVLSYSAVLEYGPGPSAAEDEFPPSEASGYASALAIALASVLAGGVGTLSWFFADPSGALVLASFAMGGSAGALFASLVLAASPHQEDVVPLSSRLLSESGGREMARLALTGGLQSHLAALAATLLVAASARPETLLRLGGLGAESETLRSELLVFPIALTVLLPVWVALTSMLSGSLFSGMASRRTFSTERIDALLWSALVVSMAQVAGLSWNVSGAFVVGVLARQLAGLANVGRKQSWDVLSRDVPSAVPALVACGALLAGAHLADEYGVALAALGMTTAHGISTASFAARQFSEISVSSQRLWRHDSNVPSTSADVAVVLALLVAAAPVLSSEAIHRGVVLSLWTTAAPALLLGVIVGAASASVASRRCATRAPKTRGKGSTVRRRPRVGPSAFPFYLGLSWEGAPPSAWCSGARGGRPRVCRLMIGKCARASLDRCCWFGAEPWRWPFSLLHR